MGRGFGYESRVWALPTAALALSAGILVGERHWTPGSTWTLAIAGSALVSWRARARPRASAVALLAGIAACGATRGASLPTAAQLEAPLRAWFDSDVVLLGRITTLPDGMADETRFGFAIESLRDADGWHSLESEARVSVAAPPRRFRGARRAMLRGVVRPWVDAGNPGETPRARKMHLAGTAASIRVRDPRWVVTWDADPQDGRWRGALMLDGVRGIRERALDALERALPAEHAGVMAALLLGLTGGVGDELNEVFARTGTAHILAVSGLNVALVVLAVHWATRSLLGRVARLAEHGASARLAAVAALVAAFAYVLLAGAEAPAIRSLVASACMLIGVVLGGSGAALASLALGAIGILAASPATLWSISFQLSFAATAGLIVAEERFGFAHRLAGARDAVELIARGALQSVLATVVATFVTLPLTTATFGRVTALGLIANPLAVPLLATAAVPVGLVGLALLPLGDGVARVVLHVAEIPVAAGLGVLRGIAKCRGLDGAVPKPSIAVAVVGTALALLVVGARPRWLRTGALAVWLSGWGLDVGGPRLSAAHRADLEAIYLAVGHGDSALLLAPSRRVVLIDAGPGSEAGLDAGRSVVAPALVSLGVDRIDVFVASHLQRDHVGGLEAVLERFQVNEIWLPASMPVPRWLQPVLVRAAKRGTAILRRDASASPVELGGLRLEVLHPPASTPSGLAVNDASQVVRASFQGRSLLFTGDLERSGEDVLLDGRFDLDAEVLKVPHHGSRTSSSFGLLRAVRPRIAVVSAPRSSSSHPSPQIVDRLEALGARVLVTGRVGAVTVRVARGQLEWSVPGEPSRRIDVERTRSDGPPGEGVVQERPSEGSPIPTQPPPRPRETVD